MSGILVVFGAHALADDPQLATRLERVLRKFLDLGARLIVGEDDGVARIAHAMWDDAQAPVLRYWLDGIIVGHHVPGVARTVQSAWAFEDTGENHEVRDIAMLSHAKKVQREHERPVGVIGFQSGQHPSVTLDRTLTFAQNMGLWTDTYRSR